MVTVWQSPATVWPIVIQRADCLGLSGPAGSQEMRRPARSHVSVAQEAPWCHPMCDVWQREEASADVFNLHLQSLHEIV